MSTSKENGGFLLRALLNTGLSDEQPLPAREHVATAASTDAMTPETDDWTPRSPAHYQPQAQSVAPGSRVLHRLGSGSRGPEDDLQTRLGQLVGRANSKDSSDEEDSQRTEDRERHKEKLRSKVTEGPRQSAALERVNGQEVKRGARVVRSTSVEKGGESLEERGAEQEQKRGDGREVTRVSKRRHRKDLEKEAEVRRSGSSAGSPAVTPSAQEGGSNHQVRPEQPSALSVRPLVAKRFSVSSSFFKTPSFVLCVCATRCVPSLCRVRVQQVGQSEAEQQQRLQLLSSVLQQVSPSCGCLSTAKAC